MTEVCAKCRSVPIYVNLNATDQSGPSETRVPYVCSNPNCDYSNPDLRDSEWVTRV